MIKQYLRDILNYHKNLGEWKIQLTVEINFNLLKILTRTMQITSDNIEIIIGNETDEIIKNLFESFLQKNQ